MTHLATISKLAVAYWRSHGVRREQNLLVLQDALRDRYGDAVVGRILRRARDRAEVWTEASATSLPVAVLLDIDKLEATDDLGAATRPTWVVRDKPVGKRPVDIVLAAVRGRPPNPRRPYDYVVIVSDGSSTKPDWWTFPRKETAALFVKDMRDSGYHEIRVERRERDRWR